MKKLLIAGAVAAVLCTVALNSNAGSGKSSADKSALVAHGEYLVKELGQCGDCHTPMNEMGQYVQGKWLQGTKLTFAPTVPVPGWADTSANIAGLPGWDHAKAMQFFMTGLAPNGQPARPPMPAYHMTKADAEAVVAYLESLKK
ncbi:MAG: c-type cytochrome [Candidatus Korobacteraceae bacterium]